MSLFVEPRGTAVRLGWKAAFTFPFEDPEWKRKLFVGGLLILLCPPIGWTIALGYRRAAGLRLRAGLRPPLPEWTRSIWSYYFGGVGAVSVILGSYVPFLILYAAIGFDSLHALSSHIVEIVLFLVLIAFFPPLFLPTLPGLYSYLFPWIAFTPAEIVVLVL